MNLNLNFDLPETGTDNPPAFLTVVTCQDWLATVPLANPAQAQVTLLRQLNLLQRYTLPTPERLKLLECLRETVGDVQRDVAKKFASKPLPLSPPEQAAFDGTVAVWQVFLAGYLRCLQSAAANDRAAEAPRALIAQRALSVFADWGVDLCRGEKLPDANFWTRLHSVFTAVEQLGIATEPVQDASRHGSTPTTALAAYSETHLLHIASPYELPHRHLDWVASWSRRWGGKLALMTSAPPTDGARSGVPLFVDLGSGRPAGYISKDVPLARWLDTGELRKSIKTRIAMLQEGEQPAKLQLGEDCTQPAAGLLLERVYQRWCKGGANRRHERRPTSGGCEFIVGIDAVHYYLSDRKPFRPPVRDENMLRKERDEIATFGQRVERQESNYSDEHGYEVEDWALIDDWQLLDQSTSGLRLRRPLKRGLRIGSGQLVAIKIAGSANFVIGGVRWIVQEDTETPMLSVGIQLFPGQARPMAVRPADPGSSEAYKQGLRLPEVPSVHEPAALVVPAGTFRIGRPVDVLMDGKTEHFCLTHVLDRGSEFERCTFEIDTKRP